MVGEGLWKSNQGLDDIKRWGGCTRLCAREGKGIGAAMCKPSRWGFDLWSGYEMAVGEGIWESNQGIDNIKRRGGCTRSCVREGERDWCSCVQTEPLGLRLVVWV